jgi:hypothetical protein
MKSTIKVAVTGGPVRSPISLLPRIASGSPFGLDQPVEERALVGDLIPS